MTALLILIALAGLAAGAWALWQWARLSIGADAAQQAERERRRHEQ